MDNSNYFLGYQAKELKPVQIVQLVVWPNWVFLDKLPTHSYYLKITYQVNTVQPLCVVKMWGLMDIATCFEERQVATEYKTSAGTTDIVGPYQTVIQPK